MTDDADGRLAEDSYDSVRRALIDRGYLHGPIERFVLRDLMQEKTPARMARTAAKAALLGGSLLGVLLASAAAAAHRPLLRATDLPLLWAYFAGVAAIALFVLDLVAAATVTALARRRGARSTDALRASTIVGLPTLAYLVLLWIAHRPGTSLVGDALFLVAAVAVTLLIAWLAGLVSLVDVIGSTGQVPDRIRRPVLVAVLAIGAIGIGLGALHNGTSGGARAAAPFEPRPVAHDLLFVGVDGLDAGLLERAGESALPNLHAAIERGARFTLSRDGVAEPAEVWTTLLTGSSPEAHRVLGAETRRLPGVATPLPADGADPLGAAMRFVLPTRTVPASGVGRPVRNLPEILGLRRPTVSVGWWATWPAVEPEAGGFVVSDRVLPKLLSGAPPDRDTAPGSLYHRLARDFEDGRRDRRASFDRRFGDLGDLGDPTIDRLAWESFLIDSWAWDLALRLEASEARATFVYLPGLDILRHRLADETDETDRARAAERVVDRYVGWLDEILGNRLRQPERSWVLVADRGRHGTGSGFVIVADSRVTAGCDGPDLEPRDLTPLVLALRGFPLSRELSGRLPVACMEPARDAPQVIAGYGRRPIPRGPSASPFDAEMLERLRSLGYLN